MTETSFILVLLVIVAASMLSAMAGMHHMKAELHKQIHNHADHFLKNDMAHVKQVTTLRVRVEALERCTDGLTTSFNRHHHNHSNKVEAAMRKIAMRREEDSQ